MYGQLHDSPSPSRGLGLCSPGSVSKYSYLTTLPALHSPACNISCFHFHLLYLFVQIQVQRESHRDSWAREQHLGTDSESEVHIEGRAYALTKS